MRQYARMSKDDGDATFVGVYDGHGGPEASRCMYDHLFLHLTSELSSFHFYKFLINLYCS